MKRWQWVSLTLIFGTFFIIYLPLRFVEYNQIRDLEAQFGAAKSHWKTTNGIITESAVNAIGTSKAPLYSPQVSYRYSVDGSPVLGQQRNFLNVPIDFFDGTTLFNSPENAKKAIAALAVGATVPVLYNPDQTSNSYVNTTVNYGANSYLLFATFVYSVVVCGVGILAWVYDRTYGFKRKATR